MIHDEKVSRFEVFESGQIAYLEYKEVQGIARALTETCVRYAACKGLRIRPVCSYARAFFERHAHHREVLVQEA